MTYVCRSCCTPVCVCTLGTVPGYSGCNHPPTTLSLTGIGRSGSNPIVVTATSSNTALIPNPTVTYTSPNATGSLAITFSGSSGTATISVTVSSTGCTPVTKTATITVSPSARPPFLNPSSLPTSITLVNNAFPTTYNFSGVTHSPDVSLTGGASLAITAFSTNPGAVPNPSVTYTSPNSTGSFTAGANFGTAGQTGTIAITVTQSNITNTGCFVNSTTYLIPFNVT